MTQKFIAGQIGSPFGINGFLKVHSFSGEIEHLLKLKSVILKKDGKEQIYQIDECTPSNQAASVVMRFSGIDNPEKAKSLTGAQILIEREQAAPLQENEYYLEDLKGLEVIAADGKIIGSIIDIIEGGGESLAEIKIAKLPVSDEKTVLQDKREETKLVPFRNEFFPQILMEKRQIILQNLWILE